jgi:hypothetical protein
MSSSTLHGRGLGGEVDSSFPALAVTGAAA